MTISAQSAVDGTRLRLPACFRTQREAPSLIVCKGVGPCLYLFSDDGYARFMDALVTDDSVQAHRLRRFFASSAWEAELDVRGRLYIGRALMEYAGFRDRVVWRVAEDRLEVWDVGTLESSR